MRRRKESRKEEKEKKEEQEQSRGGKLTYRYTGNYAKTSTNTTTRSRTEKLTDRWGSGAPAPGQLAIGTDEGHARQTRRVEAAMSLEPEGYQDAG